MSLIKLNNVSKIYGVGSKTEIYALRDVSIEIDRGEFIAVVGPSGAGKTTMFNIIGLLDSGNNGTVYLNDTLVSKLSSDQKAKLRNEYIGYVFQKFNLIPNLTAYENVVLPILLGESSITKKKKDEVTETFNLYNLEKQLNKYPKEMSGGEQQRVAIIRALVNEPSIILADEPTGSLDSKMSEYVFETLERVHKEKEKTVIYITHNNSLAERAERIISIEDGRIVSDEKNTN